MLLMTVGCSCLWSPTNIILRTLVSSGIRVLGSVAWLASSIIKQLIESTILCSVATLPLVFKVQKKISHLLISSFYTRIYSYLFMANYFLITVNYFWAFFNLIFIYFILLPGYLDILAFFRLLFNSASYTLKVALHLWFFLILPSTLVSQIWFRLIYKPSSPT
jgi:hypothetical protein